MGVFSWLLFLVFHWFIRLLLFAHPFCVFFLFDGWCFDCVHCLIRFTGHVPVAPRNLVDWASWLDCWGIPLGPVWSAWVSAFFFWLSYNLCNPIVPVTKLFMHLSLSLSHSSFLFPLSFFYLFFSFSDSSDFWRISCWILIANWFWSGTLICIKVWLRLLHWWFSMCLTQGWVIWVRVVPGCEGQCWESHSRLILEIVVGFRVKPWQMSVPTLLSFHPLLLYYAILKLPHFWRRL